MFVKATTLSRRGSWHQLGQRSALVYSSRTVCLGGWCVWVDATQGFLCRLPLCMCMQCKLHTSRLTSRTCIVLRCTIILEHKVVTACFRLCGISCKVMCKSLERKPTVSRSKITWTSVCYSLNGFVPQLNPKYWLYTIYCTILPHELIIANTFRWSRWPSVYTGPRVWILNIQY